MRFEYYVEPFGAKIEVTGEKGDLLRSKIIPSQEVYLGVRPEHIVLKDHKEENTIEATILVNEMMGSELYLHVETETKEQLVVRVPTINLEKEQRENLVYGNKVYLSFEGKVMHFFDIETEKNLIY